MQLQEVNITMIIAILSKEVRSKIVCMVIPRGKPENISDSSNSKLEQQTTGRLYGKINKSKRFLPLPSLGMICKLSSGAPAQLLTSHNS